MIYSQRDMSTYRRFSIVLFSAVFLFALPVFSQDAVYPAKKKPEPATLHNAITIIWEPVVTREWPVLRDLVNALSTCPASNRDSVFVSEFSQQVMAEMRCLRRVLSLST